MTHAPDARPLPPLPAGMRDWLPDEARALSALARSVLGVFELNGYQRVTVPAFEYAEVLERGLGALDATEVLRFVEPETGEVVALRPDMTPQVARLVASRLADAPLPARLCYEGSVVRLRRERARRRRQIPQAGIELVGAPPAAGDLEVLRVAVEALREAGLTEFVLDIGHARIAGALVDEADEEHRSGVVEALSLQDRASVEARARAAGLDDATCRALVTLIDAGGGSEVLPDARRALAGTAAEPGLVQLESLLAELALTGLVERVYLNLSEVRHLAYYTGMQFQILAAGPGEAIASGGRYDGLFTRFGAPRPAAGFAIDLDNLAWATAAAPHVPVTRVLLEGAKVPHLQQVAQALRGSGISCSVGAGDAYARAWGYSHRVELGTPWRVTEVASGKVIALSLEGDALTELVKALGPSEERTE